MNPGRLDRHVTLLRPIISRAADGAAVTTWQVHARLWAARRPVRVAETIAAAGQGIPVAETLWTIRHTPGITADFRLRDESGALHALIGPPRELQRLAWLEIPTQSIPASDT